MNQQKLQAIGWKPFFEQQIQSAPPVEAVIARVSAHHGSQVVFHGVQGEFSADAQLAESAGEIAVGDWLVLNAQDNRALKRLERHSVLYRKAAGEEVKPQVIAANIDTIFIVSSCNDDFNLSRIERYLALTLQSGANPVVVLTKADLYETNDALLRQVEKLHADLLVEVLDARDPQQAEVLTPWCRTGQTVALLGSSGVGKSTLANALGVGGLKTGEIRENDGKGRHTTTARSLHLLPGGGVLVDNPGMRELQLPACEDGVADLFEDVIRIAEGCRFNNCRHEGDAGCAIMAALESGELEQRRFVSYMKLNREQAHNSRSLAARRQHERKTSRMHKSIMADKRRRRG